MNLQFRPVAFLLPPGVHLPDPLVHTEKPAAPGDAVAFEGGRPPDRWFSVRLSSATTRLVSSDPTPALGTHGGMKRFQVNGNIGALFPTSVPPFKQNLQTSCLKILT